MDNRRRTLLKGLLGLPALFVPGFGAAGPGSWRPGARRKFEGRKYRVSVFHIAGFQFYEGTKLVGGMRADDTLELVREPDNPYDGGAIKLRWKGVHVGYVPRVENGLLNLLLSQGAELDCYIQEVNPETVPWHAVLSSVILVG
ncbi:MAG: HIRAN domain-containing protein [Desulfatibacillaceae bacterium]